MWFPGGWACLSDTSCCPRSLRLLSWWDTGRAPSPRFCVPALAESQTWQPANKDRRHCKRRWTLRRGGRTLFHPRRTFLVPLQKSDPRPDSSTLGVASPYVRGSCRPLPPSSSTPGIELKSIFHHTQAVICKDVIVQCIYYTVYTIYMMSQTFIPWVIIKKDFIQSFAFDMSDGENHREADSDIRTFQSTTLSTNLCIRNFNKWDPWCKQAQSRLVFLLTCTVYLKAMVRLRGRAHRSCIEVCESQKNIKTAKRYLQITASLLIVVKQKGSGGHDFTKWDSSCQWATCALHMVAVIGPSLQVWGQQLYGTDLLLSHIL